MPSPLANDPSQESPLAAQNLIPVSSGQRYKEPTFEYLWQQRVPAEVEFAPVPEMQPATPSPRPRPRPEEMAPVRPEFPSGRPLGSASYREAPYIATPEPDRGLGESANLPAAAPPSYNPWTPYLPGDFPAPRGREQLPPETGDANLITPEMMRFWQQYRQGQA